MTGLALWTFVFLHGHSSLVGRSVHDLTGPACQQLKVDTARIMGYSGKSVGECYQQGKEVK